MSDVKQIKIDELTPDADNANKGSERGTYMLDESLRQFGAGRSILVDKEGRVIAGNKTLLGAADIGLEDVLVIQTDGTKLVAVQRTDLDLTVDGTARQLAYADNRASEVGLDWDTEQILADLEGGLDLSGLWHDGELDELLEGLRAPEPVTDPGPQMDKAAELQEKWGVKLGDVWELGEHRLACGDCTEAAVVDAVMRGEKGKLLFTSPPYWVGMEYETQTSENEIDEFIHDCVRCWTDFVSVDYGRIIVNTGTAAIHRVEKKRKVEVLPLVFKWQAELRQSGWLARHYRVWAKRGGFAGGRVSPKTDAVDQHWETITTFGHEDQAEAQYLGTFWSPAGSQRGQERVGTKWAQQGIWMDIHGAKSAEGKHVAAFPLEVPERNLRLYSKIGEFVLDPFLGSGTTLIACERLGRKCRGIEIEPKYVAVTLQRWHDATGRDPVLVQG